MYSRTNKKNKTKKNINKTIKTINKISNKITNKISSELSIDATSNISNLINYKSIFSHNRKIDKSIVFLKKTEFDIFYSCRYKYPILVKETITSQTGNPGLNETRIIRSEIVDPFAEDILIPKQYRHSLDDYKKFMQYGVSMGHNAPAGQHKTNMKVFSETFLLSNITPQEMVLNSGLWALMENWCKKLGENKSLYNITIFTGSISNKNNTSVKGIDISMNIPQKMFKIVCFQHINKPNITFMEIFIVNNTSYYINPKISSYDIGQFFIPNKSWLWFQNFSGININSLLDFYNINSLKIKPFRNVIQTDIHLYSSLHLLMKKSNWYGYLIYAKNLNELEKNWKECQLYEKEFGDLNYHREFYELVKAKFTRNNKDDNKDDIVLFEPIKNIPKLYNKSNYNSNLKLFQYTKKNKKNTKK